MPSWPGSLPQSPLWAGMSESLPDLVLRTQMDSGPPKTRKRFTAGVRPLALAFVMTEAQVSTFDSFFLSDIAGGATSFTFTHPRTNASVTVRIVGAPRYTPVPPDHYRVDMTMEILP